MKKSLLNQLLTVSAISVIACSQATIAASQDRQKPANSTQASEPLDSVIQSLYRDQRKATGLRPKSLHALASRSKPMDGGQRNKWQETYEVTFEERLQPGEWIVSGSRNALIRFAQDQSEFDVTAISLRRKIAPEANRQEPFAWQKRENDLAAYTAIFHKNVTARQVEGLLKTGYVAGIERYDAKAFPYNHTATLVIDPAQLEALASLDLIQWIEPLEPPLVSDNEINVQPLSNVDDVRLAPYDLDGTGITVGVWEVGSTLLTSHLDFTPRATNEAGQTATVDAHAMNVAGVIASSGLNTANTEGMAPNANLSAYDSVSDVVEMPLAVNSAGGVGDPTPITISNHSYSIGVGWNTAGNSFSGAHSNFGQYTSTSVSFDSIIYDTDLKVFVSASNDRDDDWDTVSSGGTIPSPTPPNDCLQDGLGVDAGCTKARGNSKNATTVGAMNTAASIAILSNFGPTDDGRLKPDLMAHGMGVTSLGEENTTDTSAFNGTSQSTPAVAGIAALMDQQAAALGISLSAAAMKALLIQTAQDVTVGVANTGPDFATGWGIANAQAAADLLRRPGGPGILEDSLDSAGAANAKTYPFFVPAGQAEMHMTLAWTDPEGSILTPQTTAKLVNDLDLRLIAPDGTIHQPWSLNPATPGIAALRDGGDDTLNNVEQVSVLTPDEGTWTAQVSAKSGSFPTTPQAFALAGPITSRKSDIMMVLDVSGSMNGASANPGTSKLEAMQSSAEEFINYVDLVGGHNLGITAFNSGIVPTLPVIDIDPLVAADAQAALIALSAGGGTNIVGGVTTANLQFSMPGATQDDNIVFLFSDGRHNSGGGLVSDIDGVLDNDTKFYGVGFGSVLNTTELSAVATNHNGAYFEEQALSPTQLSKLFMTVAGLSVNEDIIIDPDYTLSKGDVARLPVYAAAQDNVLTFATHWLTEDRDQLSFSLQSPGNNCKIPMKDHAGVKIRRGSNYNLLRLTLPYICEDTGQTLHAGRWQLSAKVNADEENVNMMVLGKTRLRFRVETAKTRKGIRLKTYLTDGQKRLNDKYRVEAYIVKLPTSKKGSLDQDITFTNPERRRALFRDVKLTDSLGKPISEVDLSNRLDIADKTASGKSPAKMSEAALKEIAVLKKKLRPRKIRLKQSSKDDAQYSDLSLSPGNYQIRLVAHLEGEEITREHMLSVNIPER